MIAFLRKADRSGVVRHVHAGWVAALAAGVATWAAATYLIGIRGASRELTVGFGSIFASAVLLSVGIWMHATTRAAQWQRYLRDKLDTAVSALPACILFLQIGRASCRARRTQYVLISLFAGSLKKKKQENY